MSINIQFCFFCKRLLIFNKDSIEINPLNNIGVILFDIDGVIRSVENSYRLSLKKTVFEFCGWEPSYKDIDNAKNEGIWNNDWDLSLELINRYIKNKI